MHISRTHIAILPNKKENKEGPRLTRILELEKNRVTENFCYVDCRGFPTNVKILHLCVLKPKTGVVESTAVKTAEVGDPLYTFVELNILEKFSQMCPLKKQKA